MAVIILRLGESERLDVPSVVAGLQEQFPGTMVTANNSFEAERVRVTASMTEIAAESTPIRHPHVIIQSITNKEKTMGPGVDVTVPNGDSLWSGHVWVKNIMLSSDGCVSAKDFDLLTAFFRSLAIGNIDVVS